MSSGKWRPFCLDLNVLNTIDIRLVPNDAYKMSMHYVCVFDTTHLFTVILRWINLAQSLDLCVCNKRDGI